MLEHLQFMVERFIAPISDLWDYFITCCKTFFIFLVLGWSSKKEKQLSKNDKAS